MLKSLKIIIPAVAIVATVGLVGFIGNGFASDQPEKTAFQDYLTAVSQKSPKQGKSLMPQNASSLEGLQLSSFSIPIFRTPDANVIKSYKGTSLIGMLQPTKEKLWFMMKGEQPEGLVVADDVQPIKMGGKNRSKDLMNMYKVAKKAVKKENQIRYFEFVGQGVFVAKTSKGEQVYLSQGAAQILNLPAGKQLASTDVITKMKELLK
jgi:hypothetical protein